MIVADTLVISTCGIPEKGTDTSLVNVRSRNVATTQRRALTKAVIAIPRSEIDRAVRLMFVESAKLIWKYTMMVMIFALVANIPVAMFNVNTPINTCNKVSSLIKPGNRALFVVVSLVFRTPRASIALCRVVSVGSSKDLRIDCSTFRSVKS